jgi:hypothetical protein
MFVFVDLEGTIMEYSDEMFEFGYRKGIYDNAKPIKEKMDTILEYGLNSIYVITYSDNQEMSDEKNKWLNNNFNVPMEHRIQIPYSQVTKQQYIEFFCDSYGLERGLVLVIDDDVTFLRSMKRLGYNVKHVSNL